MKKIKVLIIDNYDSFTYNLYQSVKNIGVADVRVQRNNTFDLYQVQPYTHILISPGPGIPDEAGMTIPVIRSYTGRKSILGICLGHQAIAEAFGGRLLNKRNVIHGKSSVTNICEPASPLFFNIPAEIKTGRYHSWMVDQETLPEKLFVTAVDETGEIMGLSHREHPVFGLQFHPESVLTPMGERIIQNWLERT